MAPVQVHWRSTPAIPGSEAEAAKRARAAGRVGDILAREARWSSFWPEIERAAQRQQLDRWMDAFTASLALRFGDKGMNAAAAAWRRWEHWHGCQPVLLSQDAGQPEGLDLATWLEDVSERGPTAPAGILAALKWLRSQLGLAALPLDSPLLVRFSLAAPGAVVQPMAPALPLAAWSHLDWLASESQGAISCFC